MRYVELGRTDLRVSVAGLGCGGPSRLGLTRGAHREEVLLLVRRALELGVNIFDTAPVYGTEAILGDALRGMRGDIVISTKARPGTAAELGQSLDESLSRLRTSYVDLLLLHGVTPEMYPRCVAELLPELKRLKQEGKTRFIGLTEAFETDSSHAMLESALHDDFWDCVMFAYSPTNPSAAERILPRAQEKRVGTLIMRAARDAAASVPFEKPRAVDMHYRFCSQAPGVNVVLTGTGSAGHLEANIASISG